MSIMKTPITIEVRDYPRKGRGICVREGIPEGTVIESLPVLVLDSPIYARVKELPFINHTFVWRRDGAGESGAIGFGFASLCNHSLEPNAVIHKNYDTASIDLVALRPIASEEEITIRYKNAHFDIV